MRAGDDGRQGSGMVGASGAVAGAVRERIGERVDDKRRLDLATRRRVRLDRWPACQESNPQPFLIDVDTHVAPYPPPRTVPTTTHRHRPRRRWPMDNQGSTERAVQNHARLAGASAPRTAPRRSLVRRPVRDQQWRLGVSESLQSSAADGMTRSPGRLVGSITVRSPDVSDDVTVGPLPAMRMRSPPMVQMVSPKSSCSVTTSCVSVSTISSRQEPRSPRHRFSLESSGSRRRQHR